MRITSKIILTISLVILLLACLFFGNELWQLQKLPQQPQANLIAKPTQQSVDRQIFYKPVKNKDKLLGELFSLIQLSHLRISALQVVNDPTISDKEMMVQVNLAGSFAEFTNLIFQLANAPYPILFTEVKNSFSGPDQLHAALSITIFPWQLTKKIAIRHDYFNTLPLPKAKVPLFSYPLGQLRWVGYLSSAQGFRALVMLPDGATHLVAMGECLGVERACLKAISELGVKLQLKNQLIQIAYQQNKGLI
jgi:hypothetical protein